MYTISLLVTRCVSNSQFILNKGIMWNYILMEQL